jgi:N-acylneuraminate cytidylyltransferase
VSSSVTAFIPLKGHSQRVPGKNMRDFAGRPLFHVIVGTLRDADTVGEIWIDTDDDAIASSAEDLEGVHVIRRRPELVGDDVSVNRLIRAFLDDHPVEHVLQTHATNPLLTAATIDDAVRRYLADDTISSLFSVTRMQARFYTADMRAINHDPAELIPTQELDPLYLENSNFYVFSRSGFLAHDRRITDDTAMYEMDALEAADIDEEADFALALAAYRARP